MNPLVDRVRRALAGVQRRPMPEPATPSGATVGEDLAEAFRGALEGVAGRLVRVADRAEARAWVEAAWPGQTVAWSVDAPDEATLRAAEVGVDEADALIAESGTVVRSYPHAAAHRISLIPPVSVFVADETALVRDLPAALERIAGRHAEGRAATVLVTGPSRTADIEKQLVIPAHGPRELIVILVADA